MGNKYVLKVMAFGALMSLLMALNSCSKKEIEEKSLFTSAGTVTDIDGNIYEAVKIGNQVWMASNLKTTKYKNDNSIPYVTDSTWLDATYGIVCAYDNDSSLFGSIYGMLYNWNAVNDNRGICPNGWHVPSSSEYQILIDFVGGFECAGKRLKVSYEWTTFGQYGYCGGNNLSGFSGLPGGRRGYSDEYIDRRYSGYWWCSDLLNSDNDAMMMTLYCDDFALLWHTILGFSKLCLSVRCLKD